MKNVSEIDSDDNLSIDLCADPIADEEIGVSVVMNTILYLYTNLY
jgi:hypothetical protein